MRACLYCDNVSSCNVHFHNSHSFSTCILFNRYLGEVVTEAIMHDRSENEYKDEHHEYCMSLGNGEVIDATRKVRQRKSREEGTQYTVQLCTV